MKKTYHAQVPVYGGDALVGARLQELGCDHLLDCQHNALLAPDADRGAAILDRFDGVLNLKVAAIGGEDGVGEIVARAYRRLSSATVSRHVLRRCIPIGAELEMGGVDGLPLWRTD